MAKELEPIIPDAEDFWRSVLLSLADDPKSIQAVIMRDPVSGQDLGTFRVSTVKEDERPYLLIDNVSDKLNREFAANGKIFDMKKFGDGVYLIPLSSPIFL